MTSQHSKGTVGSVRGKIEESVGKLTGDRREEVKGKIRQVQGHAQQGLGDAQDAIRKARDKPQTR